MRSRHPRWLSNDPTPDHHFASRGRAAKACAWYFTGSPVARSSRKATDAEEAVPRVPPLQISARCSQNATGKMKATKAASYLRHCRGGEGEGCRVQEANRDRKSASADESTARRTRSDFGDGRKRGPKPTGPSSASTSATAESASAAPKAPTRWPRSKLWPNGRSSAAPIRGAPCRSAVAGTKTTSCRSRAAARTGSGTSNCCARPATRPSTRATRLSGRRCTACLCRALRKDQTPVGFSIECRLNLTSHLALTPMSGVPLVPTALSTS